MRIDEPTTAVTDLILGGTTVWMGLAMGHRAVQGVGPGAWLWCFGFLAAAAAAVLGAASHGLAYRMSVAMRERVWSTTLIAVGCADLGLGAGATVGLAEPPLSAVLVTLLAAKALVFVALVLSRPEFRIAAYDYAVTMALLLVLALPAIRHDMPGAALLAAGIGAGFAAAALQRSGIRLHRRFNHNDLYHVVQLVAFALMYSGAVNLLGA